MLIFPFSPVPELRLKMWGKYMKLCDALIIGSYFKTDGKWNNPVDPDRVDKFMKKIK